jgi:hypothetical protein
VAVTSQDCVKHWGHKLTLMPHVLPPHESQSYPLLGFRRRARLFDAGVFQGGCVFDLASGALDVGHP